MLVYLNGEYLPRGEARVSVDDRGFVFGDGVYEVIRSVHGRLFLAEPHWRRMAQSMRALGMRLPEGVGEEVLHEISLSLLRRNRLEEGEATVYVQVTRGAALRTHHFPPADTPPTLFVAASPFVPAVEQQAGGVAAITHPDLRWSRCDLKTINLLPNTLAKQRAVEAGAAEAVLVRDGVVTEGASTNVFGVLNGALRTHPLSNRILAGITREVVLELAAAQGVPVVEHPLRVEELARMDELFLSGTTTDVLPIVRLDGRVVGDGRPGPVTAALQGALAERMASAALAEHG